MNGTWLAALRPRPDWLPRAALGLGTGSTVAMNVTAGSRGGPGGALIGGLIPVAFVVALETLIWLIRQIARRPWGWLWCAAAGLPLAGLAAITGIVSYLHALTVVEWTGSTGTVAHLIPLVPDQLIVCGSAALMAVAFTGRRKEPEKRAGAAPGLPGEAGSPHVPRRPAKPKAASRGTGKAVSRPYVVRELVKDLPAARVAELAALSKRDLAAELEVTPWAAEVWLRDNRVPAVNGANGGAR